MVLNCLTVARIKKLISPIFKAYPVEKAVLFGSFTKGNVTESSDVDLYIKTSTQAEGPGFCRPTGNPCQYFGKGCESI